MSRVLTVLFSVAFVLSATLLPAQEVTPLNLQVTPLEGDLVSVMTSTKGETRAEALEQAKSDAVLATAGRVLMDGKLVVADQLLRKYLSRYAGNYVEGVEVLEDTFTGGLTQLNSRVFVNYNELVRDMEEKRFLYEPAYRPRTAVFLEETLDEEAVPGGQNPARDALAAALQGQGMKVYQGEIEDPSLGVDVREDPLLLDTAIVSAERRRIEIIFSGESTTTLREEKNLYYDRFYFYDCAMEVSMIRVDTGETLHTVMAEGSASARDRGQAISGAIERAAQVIAEEIRTEYRKVWPQLVQSVAQYEILLTGTNDELINIIQQHIEQLGRETQIYLKKKFGASAILTVSTNADREDLVEILQVCPYPTLTIIRQEGDKKFEVQVSG